MLSVADRLAYLSISLWKRLRRKGLSCPNCGATDFSVEDRKYLVTELRRCKSCRLMYRAPVDSEVENERFYQFAYKERIATDLPDAAELDRLLACGFRCEGYDYSRCLEILRVLGLEKGDRVFDFGCSWGYGTWQLRAAGFEVTAFEISRPRAAFGRRALGLDIVDDLSKVDLGRGRVRPFDCFFCSHVIEHVPRPAAVLDLARRLVRAGGWFVALTPNGSREYRQNYPEEWHRLWGKVHPNMIDPEFWHAAFGGRRIFLGTSPIDLLALREFAEGRPVSAGSLDGRELVCIARI